MFDGYIHDFPHISRSFFDALTEAKSNEWKPTASPTARPSAPVSVLVSSGC